MNVKIKTKEEVDLMKEGGKKLAFIRDSLMDAVKEGVSAWEIETLANDLIKKEGGAASFKMVPGYSWATCININDGIVHGIPKKDMIFKKGDIVSVDVGMHFKGFHTDTSSSVLIGDDKNKQHFLSVGKNALKLAINEAKVGNKVYDISKAIEDVLTEAGFSPVLALTGHGVGKALHEDPLIPCFVPKGASAYTNSVELVEGMVLAIEVMYAEGGPDIETEEDGWTIRTKDGKISALFEETVAVEKSGPFILTKN